MLRNFTECEYQRLLVLEGRKWGDHLQVEATRRWNAWLDHPLIAANYRRRALVEGKPWQKWVPSQLGGPAARSLDLGCGSGGSSFAVHEAGASVCLEGYDVSEARVAEAEKHRLARGIPGGFSVADVNRLRLPEDRYDLIFSSHSFHHFLELEDVMEQVSRALTSRGFFVLDEYVGPSQFQWTDQQRELVRARLSLIPERLRISSASGMIKREEGRPAVEAVVAESPFESVRSAEITSLFHKHFEVVWAKSLGGTLQHLLYNGITHHFSLEDAEAVRQVKGIIALENELIDRGSLSSDFKLLIGRRKREETRAFSIGGFAGVTAPLAANGRMLHSPVTPSERTWHIGMCGTFDVANYGDLLFPLIAEAELARRLEGKVILHRFSYNAKSAADWAYDVTSVSELPEKIKHLDGMLIGGGFIIRFDKEVAPGYAPPRDDIHHPTGYWLTPALLAVQHDIPLVWNAPGMHGNEIPAWAVPLMKLTLQLSRHVAVRDEPTKAALEGLAGVDVPVVPDTAFRLAQLFPFSDEPSVSFLRLRQMTGLHEPYIIIQATLGLESFVQFIKKHAEKLQSYRFVALPIGPVLGESAEILDPDLPGLVRLTEWPDPLLIAELIARSEAVVGHSYHLMITALGYGVPIFTGQDMRSGKYTALGHYQTVHPLPGAEENDLDWFLARLGVADCSELDGATHKALVAHWDHIADAIRQSGPKTSLALNRFWQGLPGLLEKTEQNNSGLQELQAAKRENAELRARLAQTEARDRRIRDILSSSVDEKDYLPPRETFSKPGMILLDRIRQHRLETSPFDWAFIDGLYRPEDALQLAATYPMDHFKLLSAQGGEKDYEYEARSLIGMNTQTVTHPERLSEAWQSLAQSLLSPEYRAALSRLTGLDLAHVPMEVNVFHFGPGCSLGAHCDLPDKLVTHVLYFNQTWNTEDGGCLNILRSGDLADVAAIIPPLVGNSAIIVRSDHSWHAVPRVVTDSPQSRRSVTVTFYQPGSTSSMWPQGDPSPLHDYVPRFS